VLLPLFMLLSLRLVKLGGEKLFAVQAQALVCCPFLRRTLLLWTELGGGDTFPRQVLVSCLCMPSSLYSRWSIG